MMIIAFLAAAATATASPGSDTIVVTGVPLSQLKAEADKCAKGGCALRQDAVASVRYAEGLFRQRSYVTSRQQLERTVARNRSRAKSDPEAMSALYEATATVARRDGEQSAVADATYARARLIRDTAGPDSAQRLLADLDVIDIEAARRESIQTESRYNLLTKRSLELGQPGVAAQLILHHVAFSQARGRKEQASRLLQRVRSGEVAPSQSYRLVAGALAVRFTRDGGDRRAADALIADFVSQPPSALPVLVWAPKVPRPTDVNSKDPTVVTSDLNRESDLFTVRWVDIVFTIRADGSVEGAEVLRGNRGEQWVAPLIETIVARRYMPLKAASDVGYRVERWTLTADYDTPIGSLIRRRMRSPHFEQLDISGEPPKTAD